MTAWTNIRGGDLRQGDVLHACQIPLLADDFGETTDVQEIPIATSTLIVLTQSCDLVVRDNGSPKAPSVALCRIYSLADYSVSRPSFQTPKVREEARRGQVEGVHLLHSPDGQQDNQKVLVAHFRELVSLPFGYLSRHAISLGDRPRLNSPYVEHFAQGFARFFMRVGLPSDIPAYR